MFHRRFALQVIAGVSVLMLLAAACSGKSKSTASGTDCSEQKTPVITFAAYSTPREVYGKIIKDFQDKWKEEHDGQSLIFQESYGGSTTQAENIVNGFQADVFAASLQPDLQKVVDAGLITHDWANNPDKGMVSTSVAVFDVRPGNPDDIANWDDLAKDGMEVLTPDPAASGGARWNIVGAYGAATRGKTSTSADDSGAQELLTGIFGNVIALDKSARDSIKNFESGNGNVAITYENEVLTARAAGLKDEAVYPDSTILIENPVAVVDENAKEHCVEEVAQAFVDYLHTPEAGEQYSSVGFLRPVDEAAAKKGDPANGMPAIKDLFTVEDLGGWDAVDTKVFGEPDGVFTKAFADANPG